MSTISLLESFEDAIQKKAFDEQEDLPKETVQDLIKDAMLCFEVLGKTDLYSELKSILNEVNSNV